MAAPRRLHVGRPIWLGSSARQGRRYPRLHQDYDVDVAVVGGGITGALVATLFAGAGIEVALLEARRIGEGSTAASTGLLLKEADPGLIELTRRYGPAAARRVWGLCESGTRDLIALLRDRDIRCDLEERDSVYSTTGRQRFASLHAEFIQRRAAGFRPALAVLPRAPGDDRDHGTRSHPHRWSRAAEPIPSLSGAHQRGQQGGARVFELSPVRRIDRRRDGVRVTCDHGAVRASHVVIATGYATASFKPLAGRFRLNHTYVLATTPISERVRRDLGLGGVMLWDNDRPYHYARWTRDHRLLLGGADRPLVPRQRRATAMRDGMRRLHDYFTSIFPTLGDIDIECGWDGLFATTPDGLPVRWPPSPVTGTPVCPRLWRQRDDLRVPRCPHAARTRDRRRLAGSSAVRVQSPLTGGDMATSHAIPGWYNCMA